MKKYIDSEKLIAEIERWRDKAKEKYNESTYSMGRCDALAEFRNHIVSLQQERSDAYEDAMLEVKEYVDKLYDEKVGIGLCEYDSGLFDGIAKICTQLRGFIKVRISLHHTQPESELEKAARYVYESWMGGTMDDVRRDIDELGKVLNARKEE